MTADEQLRHDTMANWEDPIPGRTHVHFGPKDHQVWPIEWAEMGICWLYENRRDAWAEMALAIHDTDLPGRRRTTKSKS